MKKRNFEIIVMIFILVFITGVNVKGEENNRVYPKQGERIYETIVHERIPVGTFVIGDRGYSLDEINSYDNRKILDNHNKVYIKKDKDLWVDYNSKKEIDKNLIPEIKYLDKWGNTLFFEKEDGNIIEEKCSMALYIIHFKDNNSGIGSVVKVSESNKASGRYARTKFFSIQSSDGIKKIDELTLGDDNYVYPKIEDLEIENKVDVVIYNEKMEKIIKFNNLEVVNNRIIITDTSERERETIYVSNAKEFFYAIGPERTIVMKKGRYNLRDYEEDDGDGRHIRKGYNGIELIDVSGLIVEGESEQEPVEIVTRVDEGYVLKFSDSENIILNNIELTLLASRGGESGPLSLSNIKDFKMNNCKLSGGGRGLTTYSSKGIEAINTTIESSQEGIAYFTYSSDIKIQNSIIKNNGEKYGICIADSHHIDIRENSFVNNKVTGDFFYFREQEDVKESKDRLVIENNTFKNNAAKYFYKDSEATNITLKDNVMSDNLFGEIRVLNIVKDKENMTQSEVDFQQAIKKKSSNERIKWETVGIEDEGIQEKIEENEIITVSNEKIAKEIEMHANKNPEKVFVGVGFEGIKKGITSCKFGKDTGIFVAGGFAAQYSSKNIGYIGIKDNQSSKRLFYAFTAGVYNLDKEKSSVLVDESNVRFVKEKDKEKLKEAVKSLYESGCDYIMIHSDETIMAAYEFGETLDRNQELNIIDFKELDGEFYSTENRNAVCIAKNYKEVFKELIGGFRIGKLSSNSTNFSTKSEGMSLIKYDSSDSGTLYTNNNIYLIPELNTLYLGVPSSRDQLEAFINMRK